MLIDFSGIQLYGYRSLKGMILMTDVKNESQGYTNMSSRRSTDINIHSIKIHSNLQKR